MNIAVGSLYTYKSTLVRALNLRADGFVYVHVEGQDCRLDEWVPSKALGMDARKRVQIDVCTSSDSDDDSNKKIWSHGAGHGDEHTKIRNVQKVVLGEHVIDAWYYSPYPPPLDVFVEELYICEHTFKYMKSPKVFARHVLGLKSKDKIPPGLEIYRDTNLSVFRVDGTKQRLYCQNLCLLGKLFIEHKTLHYDPSPFYFFLITERVKTLEQQVEFRPIGYFSKEIESTDSFNLACILTLPPYQRKGYGRFIISLSYEISEREGKMGSPEKPLSDLAKLSYRSFWSCKLLMVLKEACDNDARPGVRDLAKQTGIRIEDTISTLQSLGFIKHLRGSFVLAVSPDRVRLQLKPYLMRNFASAFCNPNCFLLYSS